MPTKLCHMVCVLIIFLLCLKISSINARRKEVSIDYACPGGCKCATLDAHTLDKVQVHCEILRINKDELNFTVTFCFTIPCILQGPIQTM